MTFGRERNYMKKFLLALLFTPVLHAQPNHVYSSSYWKNLKIFVTGAKELIKAHPYISGAAGVAAVSFIYWYSQRDEQDPSFASVEAQGLHPVGPVHVERPATFWQKPQKSFQEDLSTATRETSPDVLDYRDFTGDFPPKTTTPLTYPTKSRLHPQEFRHNK